MSYIYLTEHSSKLSISENRLIVTKEKEILESVPIEIVEAVNVYGNGQVTTQCIHECLKREIPIIYYSHNGRYYGRLQPDGHIGVLRQRKQAVFNTSSVALELAKKIIGAKIQNQTVILRRYAYERKLDFSEKYLRMHISRGKTSEAKAINELMGYEGNAARVYFESLSELVTPDFRFHGRNRRPPQDPFNSMISLGYSILMNEVYGKLVAKGLNPYLGFIHQDRENHPALASDLMEEWRMIIVDSTVLSLITGHEIFIDHFRVGEDGGVYLTQEGMKIYMRKLEKKFRQENRYLSYIKTPVSFRRAIESQVNAFAHVLDDDDIGVYEPIIIR